MSTLDLREVECLVVLSEECHFGRTAERLYLSQGRVSQLLRSAEHRIGARIFQRSSRHVELTPLGKEFLADLRPAYDSLHHAVRRAREAARGVQGSLRVGFVAAPGETLMRAAHEFSSRYPEAEINLIEVGMSDQYGALRRQSVEAAVLCAPEPQPGFVVSSTVFTEPALVAVSTAHPLAERASVSAGELGGEHVIELERRIPPEWRAHGLAGPKACTLQEALSLVGVVRGVLVVPAAVEDYNGRRDVTFLPVHDLPESDYALVWREGSETALLRALEDELGRYGAS